MAYPKRRNGWRKIIVDGQTFRWQFRETGEWLWGGELAAQGEKSGCQQLIVEMNYLTWNKTKGGERIAMTDPPENSTQPTPRLATEAIRFGLASNWKPDEHAAPLLIKYSVEGEFRLESPIKHEKA